MSLKPDITLYSLEGSRAIRIAWLLEELKVPYTLVSSARAPNYLAPPEFKDKIPTFLSKSPTIVDNGIVVQESGAIVEYLCEHYDPTNRLIPTERGPRAKVQELIAAAEATVLLHSMPIVYAGWLIPEADAGVRDAFIEKLGANVQRDLDWLESELKDNAKGDDGKLFFVGDSLTAADITMFLSLQIIFAREMGTQGGKGTRRWGLLERWLSEMEAQEGYRVSAEKTNHYIMTK